VVSVVADGSGFSLKINKITESWRICTTTFSRFRDAPFDPFGS